MPVASVSSPLINALLQRLIPFAVLAISLPLPVESQAFPPFYLAGTKNLIQTPALYPLEQNNHLLPSSVKSSLEKSDSARPRPQTGDSKGCPGEDIKQLWRQGGQLLAAESHTQELCFTKLCSLIKNTPIFTYRKQVPMHASLHVEVKRKLTGVDFLRPSCGFCRIKLRIFRLDGKHLFPLNRLITSF